MAANTSVCAVCDLKDITVSSLYWCPDCEEALCSDCNQHHNLSKATRGHKIIPISQYQSLPTFVTDIQQFCIYHNEKFQQYCTEHECPICYKCIKEHGKCDEVVLLDDVVSEVKSSELFRDLDQSMLDVFENIKRIREDREINNKSIQTQKKEIIMKIDKTKTQINQHLDILKENVIKDLEQVCLSHNNNIKKIISSLKGQETEMKLCSKEIEILRKYASDLQTFLGMRDIQSKVNDSEKRLKSMIENKSLDNVDIQLSIDDRLQDILTLVQKFGAISIKESPSAKTNLVKKKTIQAQILIPDRLQSITTISVDLKMKFDTTCQKPWGCSMTQAGGFLFTDNHCSNEKLVILNAKSQTDYTIQLSNSYTVFDAERLNENIVAVTTGEAPEVGQFSSGISFIDLSKRKVIKFIDLPGDPYGITFDGKSLICCVEEKELHVISCTDYSLTTIPNTFSPWYSYVSTYADKIFYTHPYINKVYCSLIDGTSVWVFNDEEALQMPRGISVDDKGNVFVVGESSCNVLVISPDGKQYKEILNDKNGLSNPFAVFFDKTRKQLLVLNKPSVAHLYKISYF
ncbi:unnamed protein product [Mytilus coruscus]|uniref:B box-type domain-containing protein n=1 Tax=Mytilus coruscus TaxID=42192 RepID=A0A6J8CXN0_MYTCO|nr:unnamed protein product [Mytilus coruscus]